MKLINIDLTYIKPILSHHIEVGQLISGADQLIGFSKRPSI